MASAFAPKLSPVLMTPEPHYLPGYCGYCPRYKFTLGQTYGKLTSQMLAAPSRSGRLLLLPNCSPGAPEERPGPGGRGGGCGAIPGYTGFIPRAQNHFAKTYGEVCRRAWQDFAPHREQGARGRDQAWEAMGAPRLDVGPLPAMPEAGAAAAAAAAAAATPAFRPPGSPLALESCGPQATFIPGRDSSRRGETLPPLAKTYPTDRGLLPHYRGYVPGYKFQFGHTYGHLTCNALGQTTLEKQVLAVTQ